MSGRPKKTTVDYFPHYTTSGKTLFTLESVYGNDGYAFWFKLLEILGRTENHTFRYGNTADWLFLVAKTKVTEEKALAILKTLADLGAIDRELYHQQVIWSDNFITGLIPVYGKRATEIPAKPNFRGENTSEGGIPGEKTPQSKVKESKVDKKNTAPAGAEPVEFYKTKKGRKLTNSSLISFNSFWKEFAYPKGKAEAADSWFELNPSHEQVEEIILGAKKEAINRQAVIKRGGSPKWAQGWLSGRRWEDGGEVEDEWR